MDDFRIEVKGGKQYLCFSNENGREPDRITAGMLECNEIEGILPCYIQRSDTTVVFQYDLNGMKVLKTIFTGPVNKNRLYSFLSQVAKVCDICREYLIDPEQLLLDPDWICYDERTGKYLFAVSPFPNTEKMLNRSLMNVVNGLESDRREDRSYLVDLNDYFRENKCFDSDAFGKVLKKIGGEQNRAAVRPQRPAMPGYTGQGGAVSYAPNSQAPVQQIHASKESTAETGDEQNESRKKKGLIGDIFGKIGKEINDKAVNGSKEEKAGKGKKKTKEKPKETASEESSRGGMPKLSSFGGFAIPGTERASVSPAAAEAVRQISSEQDGKIQAQKIDLQMHRAEEVEIGRTQYVSNEAPVLQYGSVPSGADMSMNYGNESDYALFTLVKASDGERYPLTKPVTKIGRKREIVDIYIAGNTHLGRIHAVICLENGYLTIEDNASVNGTFVNGSRISEKTPIGSGDQIRLAEEEFYIE